MTTHANEPAATRLARGPAKTTDIEDARRDLAHAERRTADRLHRDAARLSDEADRVERDPAAPAAAPGPQRAGRTDGG